MLLLGINQLVILTK